eukprot:10558550-Ditylum_brightwellii.AAC.1
MYQLYLHKSKGGRGFMRLDDTHDCECAVLDDHVLKSTDTLTQIVCNTPMPTQKFLLRIVSSPKFITPESTDNNHHHCPKE